MKPKKIILLGATGSVGSSTLRLIEEKREYFDLVGISANKNVKLLKLISEKFDVKYVSYNKNYNNIKFNKNINILEGFEGLLALASINCDIVVSGISGMEGLLPALRALKSGNDIAIANKEPLVVAGKVFKEISDKNNTKILPVDSEHNSIFQCFNNEHRNNIDHITLTASGGPFLNKPLSDFNNISPDDALKHPIWNMGKKITIDSATLINKALEIVEAGHLFDLNSNQIDVVIHPEAIIHGLVHYKDGSVLANLSWPDMITPLSVAIGYPNRYNLNIPKLNLHEISQLNFSKPDFLKFPGLKYGWEALDSEDFYSVILNAANEEAVKLFLNNKINFNVIIKIIDYCLNNQNFSSPKNIDDIFEIDKVTRIFAIDYFKRTYV